MSFRGVLRKLYQELRHPRDIFDCFYFFFKVGFSFGLIPFHVNCNRVLSTSYFGYANVILRILFFNYCFIKNLCYEPSIVSFFFQTNVSQVTASSQKLNGAIAFNLIIGITFAKSRLFRRLIEQFYCLECRLTNIGVEVNQSMSAMRINVFIIFIMALNFVFMHCTLYGILMKNGCYVSVTSIVSFYSQNYIATGFVLLFYGVFLKLNSYFGALNKFLRNVEEIQLKSVFTLQNGVEDNETPPNLKVILSRPLSEYIQEALEIHQMLFQAANKANQLFTYQALIIISIAFLIIVFDAYYVLETLLGHSERQDHFTFHEFLTFFTYQILVYIIVICSIVESSNRVIEKSEMFGCIVHRLLSSARDAEVKEKLQYFSLQVIHLKLKFTAAGFFNIDRTLYFTIYGALTTYLIILLQVTATTNEISAPVDKELIRKNSTLG